MYLIFEIRYASISPVTRYPKEYSTKDLSIQYLLQCSYQQLIYYIHRSNSLDETRLKLGIRSIPVFTKNELLDILLILEIMMDGFHVLCQLESALKILNQQNILPLTFRFPKIYKMRSIDYNFSFLLFFLSVMKQKRRKYFNIRSRNEFYPFVIDTSPNRLREERS